MGKMKSKIQEQTRNRVRMHRGIKSIKENDTLSLVDTVQLRKQLFKQNASPSNEPPKLLDKLRSWAIEFNIKLRALTSLLKILKEFGMNSLPNDSRTLLKTPKSIKIEVRAGGGEYWHNGLKNALSEVFKTLSVN